MILILCTRTTSNSTKCLKFLINLKFSCYAIFPFMIHVGPPPGPPPDIVYPKASIARPKRSVQFTADDEDTGSEDDEDDEGSDDSDEGSDTSRDNTDGK